MGWGNAIPKKKGVGESQVGFSPCFRGFTWGNFPYRAHTRDWKVHARTWSAQTFEGASEREREKKRYRGFGSAFFHF